MTLVMLYSVRRCKRNHILRMRDAHFRLLVAAVQLHSRSVFVVERVVILVMTDVTDHAYVRLALLLLLLNVMRVVMMMMMMTTMRVRFLDVVVLVANVEFVVGRQVGLAEVVRISMPS